MSFSNFNLKEELNRAIKNAGFKEPSPIQKEAIPIVLEGRDMIGQAHTGTGKTVAFGLPILNMLNCNGDVEALVVVPTRELATQVSDELFRFGKFLGIKTATVYGGSSYSRQIKNIEEASIVVATPGRLIDLLKSKKINISPRFVVLDEADEMLDMGFLEDIQEIFTYLPSKRQTLLFSATMSKPIRNLAQKILNNPASVSITQGDVTNKNIRQLFYVVDEFERDDALIRLLEYKNPTKSIIFCRTRREVDRLRDFLTAQGYNAKGLHGDIEQRQRETIIRSFKSSQVDILIATDVAARGLDVNDVSHVFNYHLPFDAESYVHRIGRTGRAGKDGVALSLVTPHEFKSLQRIQQSVGTQIESRAIPSHKDVTNKQEDAFINLIREQAVEADAISLIETLKEEFTLTTLTAKLISIVKSSQEVKGANKIGKSKDEIEKLFKSLKNRRDDRDKRGSNRRRRNSNRSRSRNRNSRKRVS